MNSDLALPETQSSRPASTVEPAPASRTQRGSYILCGTDFSPGAAQAVDAAAALAVRLGEPLLLVHSMAETFREQLPTRARDALMPGARDRLHAEAERARMLGASVEQAVLPGWPDQGINEYARRVHARLIVFGCPEFGALNRWLRGSVAEVVAESSTIPTLIVHDAAPLEKWARDGRRLRVLVAADATEASKSALHWVVDWRRIQPCEVTIGCIDLPPSGYSEPVAEEALGMTSVTPGMRQAAADDLTETTRHLFGDEPSIRVVPGSAKVDEDLIQLAAEGRADLLVVGTHQRQGFERAWHRSVSRGVLRHAPISVVCVPPATCAGPEATTR